MPSLDRVPMLAQLSMSGPLAVGIATGATVRITEHGRRVGGSPVGALRVVVTFDAPLVESFSVVMPAALLRKLVAASSPFLAPFAGACAPRPAGGNGDE